MASEGSNKASIPNSGPPSREISSLLEQPLLHDLEITNNITPRKGANMKRVEQDMFSVEIPSLEPSPAKFPHMTPPSQDGKSPKPGTPLSR